ncbi:receptor-type tyrosine-protein phosphatase alpha-like [Cloeon dipterum]|uniref:receptor-type tyrosine-protein phosphatase alpha-like n=1 Tax=Cloeon dipterum TaxID=197152 RepID=UPI0032206A2A
MVTDFRWNDLPTYFTHGKFQSKIPTQEYFRLHFSILANDSAQFLFTNDSTFENGYRAVIDGWGNTHQSELQYCTAIYNANLEKWPICEIKLKIVQNQIILDGGKNWVHAEVKSEQQSPGEIEYRALTNTLTINFPDYRKNNYRTENYLSFRTNEEGLLKLHKYNVLLPFESSKLMELALESDLPNTLCIDFVFLTTMQISQGNQAFKIEIKNAQKIVIFNENIITRRKNEWTTARIFRNDIKLRKDWTITLTAHTRDLVIGGIKFCKEGFTVYKPKIENQNHCQSLVKETDTTEQVAVSNVKKIWSELIDCKKLFGEDCSGTRLCYQEGYCACFAGYQGNNCESQCLGTMFGLNCSQFSQRKCFKENFFPTNGTCREGCAAGYSLPDCIDGCTGNKYGINCYKTSSKKCLNNDINRVDGSCLQGCADGYYPPCEKACERNSYGKNCGNTSYKNCKDDQFNHVDGSCLKGCKEGYSFPDCINECEGNSYGVNCSKTSTKHCFGAKLNRATGNCLNGCEDGYSFPACEKGTNSSLLTPFTTVLAVLAVLTALGVWFYLKKWKKTQPSNQLSTVQFSNTSEILKNEIPPTPTAGANQLTHNDKDIPLNKTSTDVEEYLQKALTFNLKKEFEKFPLGQTQSLNCGSKSQNKRKNRYANLAAYDCSRVVLDLLPGDKYSDYINANYVDGFERPKAYIATQGPKISTVNDFWRMIWQENISLIVMVTNLVVGDKKKCEKYWPDVNREDIYGKVVVRSVYEEINADYVTRTLSISRDNAIRLVQQLHYTSWPDHGVPLYPQSMALFMDKINQHRNKSPILIHSSAGVGKTGTVILIDACLQMFRSHNRIDVMSIFTKMRSQRVNLVDNLAQYEFVHLVLLEIIANPKFEISCANFHEEYCRLMSNNSEKLKESFAKLEEICEKDFQRLETPARNDTDKCRYPHFISSSNAIVKISPYENVVTTSFINAVTVDGYNRAKQFIVTQVPMKNTVEDFWRMIDQFNVKQIVVLNVPHISEAELIPTKQRRFTFGTIQIALTDSRDDNSYRTLNIELHCKGKCKKVRVMCASFGWMAQQVGPPNLQALISLWGTLKIAHEEDSITIVCHDGVTASGLFLAMGFVIEKIKLEQKVDAGLAVRILRKSRPAFVSSEIQFGLVYEAALNFLNSFDTYGNFKR